ncbi:MAG: hypothetical protein LBG12_11295 [Synergistaceae bacterium]|nr:hypothetical protein [Synergistaceae bacterium]
MSIPVSHTVPYSSSDLTNRPAFRAMNSRTPNSFTVRQARPEGFVKERGGEGLRRGNQQAARVVQTQQGRVPSGKITAVYPRKNRQMLSSGRCYKRTQQQTGGANDLQEK